MLWRELGAQGDPEPWHRRLMDAYGQGPRRYHNVQHLEECLTELASATSMAERPTWIATALWFHDAVYDSRSATNEEDSATLAEQCLTEAGVGAEAVAAVRELILCTKTHEAKGGDDAALLIDIDLAILGQGETRFWAYEQGIRTEYAWVPAEVFAQKRAEILERFLQRPLIYRTEPFRLKYEAAARANLQVAIRRLREL